MDTDNFPYISVIITAYNRKEFLLNAIKSVVNQTLDKKYYEIIVIKNFTENAIDGFIYKYNIKNILIDGTLGEFLYAGLTNSTGQVISFLDDDDLFSTNKLEVIYNKFKSNKNLCYYHNGHVTVNKEYQEFDSNLGNSVVFNLSSISISKFILNPDSLKKIYSNPDDFMYLSALESDKKTIAGKEKLTYYMLHNSASQSDTKDINEYIRYRDANTERDRKAYVIFGEIFISKKANNYMKQKIADMEIGNYIFGDNKKPTNALYILKKSDKSFSTRLEILLVYILVRSHHSFRDIIKNVIIQKFLNNNEKL